MFNKVKNSLSIRKENKNKFLGSVAVVSLALMSTSAHADIDYTSVIDAIAVALVAVTAIATALFGVYSTMMAYRMIKSMMGTR